MARNRTPLKKAEVAGRTTVNPGRYRGRRSPTGMRPIGDPYPGMTPEQVAVWLECAENMPWLNGGHRVLLRLVCVLAARMETDPGMGVSAMQALGSLLSKLGATPVDECKVAAGDDDDDDADDGERFFRQAH